MPDVLEDGVQNQINNPEVEVDTNKESFALSQQLLRLKLITNKLKSAHSGVDVDWIDTGNNDSGMIIMCVNLSEVRGYHSATNSCKSSGYSLTRVSII